MTTATNTETILFSLVDDEGSGSPVWQARIDEFEVRISAPPTNGSSVSLLSYGTETVLPCDNAQEDCPDGKSPASEEEFDACCDACPYKTEEESVDSYTCLFGDSSLTELIEAAKQAIVNPMTECVPRDLTKAEVKFSSSSWHLLGITYPYP